MEQLVVKQWLCYCSRATVPVEVLQQENQIDEPHCEALYRDVVLNATAPAKK